MSLCTSLVPSYMLKSLMSLSNFSMGNILVYP